MSVESGLFNNDDIHYDNSLWLPNTIQYMSSLRNINTANLENTLKEVKVKCAELDKIRDKLAEQMDIIDQAYEQLEVDSNAKFNEKYKNDPVKQYKYFSFSMGNL